MNVESAVTAAAELATRHPTVVEEILLTVTILVLLGMVSRAWNVMLSTKLTPQRGPVKHYRRRTKK